jgi:hypothetical protein
VVAVLTTNCHVSEYLKNGPVAAHPMMSSNAAAKAHFEPTHLETRS